jgi:hypothetical protein
VTAAAADQLAIPDTLIGGAAASDTTSNQPGRGATYGAAGSRLYVVGWAWAQIVRPTWSRCCPTRPGTA